MELYKRGGAEAVEPSKQFCLCPPTSVFISLTFLEDGYRRFYLSSVHGILQARILEWVAIPFSRGWIFPTQGSNLGLLNCR